MKKSLIAAGVAVLFAVLFFASRAGAADDWGGQIAKIWAQLNALRDAVANIQLIPGPPGPEGPTGPPGLPGQQLHLYDANGQDLGILINANAYQNIQSFVSYLPSAEVFVPVDSDFRAGLVNLNAGTNGFVYFSGTDCTGIAYHRNVQVSSIGYQMMIRATGPKYYKYNGSGYGPFTSNSYIPYYSALCTNSIEGHDGYALQEITLPFAEPLAWPLHIQ